ncbi:hypothetical protein PCC8801_2693 [Rippkaea orientalis PCC 8801]|uniref:Peptidase C14 caspase catalytic subunit p20 n=1 Tax=Rippkaea orientalis (strain PCC 8801 / RF-1) TaxID=41431 RepID=B7K5G1_RIPO1|nr:caspase family protein [Rippkaea orientalis]ACK66694.1 hypothetical protein PCC8801_2693 [Rippkaea orientalis PCC 8801]
MENFRGMAIGIDGYRYWQPLQDAEANAQALYQYLSQNAQICHHQLLLLTDTSPQVEQLSTYPNRQTIQQWLDRWPNNVKLGWFVFQGYGISHQGHNYLIPIDGHPQAIPQTAIEMRSLLDTLQVKTQRLLMILNIRLINGDKGFKKRAIALAKERGIALIITVSSPQVSERLFTTALLEALRYYGYHLTLTNLEAYFRERLTPLGSPRDLSIITPMVVSPSLAAGRLPLLPFPQSEIKPSQIKVKLTPTVAQNTSVSASAPLGTLSLPSLPKSRTSVVPSPQPSPTSPTEAPVASSTSPQSKLNVKWFIWAALFSFILGFLGLIFLKLKPFQSSQQEFADQAMEENRQVLNYAKTRISVNQASRLNQAIEIVRQIEPNTPFYDEAQEHISRWSEGILEIAEGRAIQGNFSAAIAAAKLVPPDHPTFYNRAQRSIKHWQKLSK